MSKTKEINKFFISNDGFTLIPNTYKTKKRLGPHRSDLRMMRYLLVYTTASFVALIKSYALFPEIKNVLNISAFIFM